MRRWNNQQTQKNFFKLFAALPKSTLFLRLSIKIKTFNPQVDELELQTKLLIFEVI